MSKDRFTGAKRARQARADLDFTRDGPLPDVLEAIENGGGAYVVVLALADGVAGAYAARPGCPLLIVNGRQALVRQRFTLAHEFGHHRMGHASVVDDQRAISGQVHDPNEVRANAFASEFLVPKDAVAAWGGEHVRGNVTLEHVVRLAGDYGVSAQVARYALQNAGVLGDDRRAAQLDEEIAADMHSECFQRLGLQPLEDGLADAAAHMPRLAPALRYTALADLLAGAIDVECLAQRIGREPAQVTAMLTALGIDGLLPGVR
jgi:Zn-dependent peptidase ImmA (M78 family)